MSEDSVRYTDCGYYWDNLGVNSQQIVFSRRDVNATDEKYDELKMTLHDYPYRHSRFKYFMAQLGQLETIFDTKTPLRRRRD